MVPNEATGGTSDPAASGARPPLAVSRLHPAMIEVVARLAFLAVLLVVLVLATRLWSQVGG